MVKPYPDNVEKQMQRYYGSLSEKDRRRYAGIEALKLSHGGIRYMTQVLGCDYKTIKLGMTELADVSVLSEPGIRRPGGGRKSAFATVEGLDEAFLRVVSSHTAGAPMDERIKWTILSRPKIAELLKGEGISVSVTVIGQLLEKHNYRRRGAHKTLTTGCHRQRDEPFKNIEALRQTYERAGNPVMSMDTKKEN